MKKTRKMLEVEERIGEDLEGFLRREYESGKTVEKISEELDCGSSTIDSWLSTYKIPTRSRSEALLLKSLDPGKDELKRLYLEEDKSTYEIGKISKVGSSTVLRWLKKYEIPIKENKLPEKEYLEKLFIEERKNPRQIGQILNISPAMVRIWLKKYDIPTRSLSETSLPEGINKPDEEELRQLYVIEGKTAREIAGNLGITSTSVGRWLKEYDIPIRGSSRIKSSEQLMSFLQKDETARNLAVAAVSMNGESYDMEKVLTEIYDQQFPDIKRLHQLLQDNTDEVKKLMEEGITNLGYYLGGYKLRDRKIIPVLLGNVIDTIPEEHVTPSLEDRLVRLLRNEYSPGFNDEAEPTMLAVKEKIDSSTGKKKEVYQKLYDHFERVLELEKELN